MERAGRGAGWGKIKSPVGSVRPGEELGQIIVHMRSHDLNL